MLARALQQLRVRPRALVGPSAWRGLASAAGDTGSGSSGGSTGAAAACEQPAADAQQPAASEEGGAQQPVEHVISVDRSGLYNPRPHSHDPADLAAAAAAAGVVKEAETGLARHLKAVIQFGGGPITLAEYMSEALTNPQHGYYTQRDVFGAGGDFVTSPEISQMFGEMVGIWCVAAWQQLGCPPRLHLVELGPGRGTLMADLLRGTAAFADFSRALRVSMVEVSPVLRALQWQALRCPGPPPAADAEAAPAAGGGAAEAARGAAQAAATQQQPGSSIGSSSAAASAPDPGPAPAAIAGVSGWGGAAVSWHRSLDEVQPDGPALYIAHEFVDALPVHQFQRTERGWCERLVDLAAPDSPLHLRMVLSPGATPAARLLVPRRLRQLPDKQRARLRALEVCPQGMALAEGLARRVEAHGGAALIIDYGQDAPYEASLQAIRRHAFVGLLEQPGAADLSNRVDYSALRSAVEESGAAADCHGPIPQAAFLLALGIEQRLEQLAANASPEQTEALRAGFRRLTGESEAGVALTEEGMGSSYQAFCIAQRGLQPWPFGVVQLEEEPPSDDEGERPGGADAAGGQEQQQQRPDGGGGGSPAAGAPHRDA